MSTETCFGKKRVVITGMGVITPMGETVDAFWNNVVKGNSGIGHLTLVPDEDLTCKIGGECTDFAPENYMDKKEARRMDRYMQFAVAASKMAYDDAGLTPDNVDPQRFGVVLGSGAGGIGTVEVQLKRALTQGYPKTSPFLIPMMLTDSGSGRVSIELGARGPNMAIVTACATGSDCIGQAAEMISMGRTDVMVAGGAESPMCALAVAGFAAARALSQRNEEPTKASRPFDEGRDGFVMSEGSGIVILESLEHAKARGAKIYGELIGYGSSSDAYDIVAPREDGSGAAQAMLQALECANIKPEEVQYINAHGTSTPLGDIAETKAIKRVFGDHAKKGLLVSSTKSMHGHMLGAAGAIEAIISVKAIQDKTAPPTINLENQDAECDLDYVANKARPLAGLKVAMSNSFGFGGHNACLIFKEFVH
ncbi:MAG: beta-ketoacyl-ACP synthase II [Vampirovibrionales bacterium]|nr:beta-ketoacyl-ACP synthase II [Vampirovibrionales bacterium]